MNKSILQELNNEFTELSVGIFEDYLKDIMEKSDYKEKEKLYKELFLLFYEEDFIKLIDKIDNVVKGD